MFAVLKISSCRWLAVILLAALSIPLVSGDDSPCEVGYMKIIKDYAPDCIHACQQACTPLSQAVGVYFAGGDPVPQLCQDSAALKCMVNLVNKPKCVKLLDYAEEDLGFSVPRSPALVDSTCGGTPAYDEQPVTTPAVGSSPAPDTTSAPDFTTTSTNVGAAKDGNTTFIQSSTNESSTTAAVASTTNSGIALSGAQRSPIGMHSVGMVFVALIAFRFSLVV